MMYKALAVLVLLALAHADQEDIDKVILDVFGNDGKPGNFAILDDEIPCNEKVAKCVPYYKCDGQFNTDDNPDDDDVVKIGNYCSSYLEVCCLNKAILEPPM